MNDYLAQFKAALWIGWLEQTLLLVNTNQLMIRAKNQPITANRSRRHYSFSQIVLGKQVELWTTPKHKGRAVVVADIDSAIIDNE